MCYNISMEILANYQSLIPIMWLKFNIYKPFSRKIINGGVEHYER